MILKISFIIKQNKSLFECSENGDLLKKDLVDRLMDGRLSVDKVFTEAQQTKLVAAYSNQKKQPNAFEKRVSKAAVEKKEQKATVSQSQEVTQDKLKMV